MKNKLPQEFTKELENLINEYSLENGSDTPDFILAEYLTYCLQTFNKTCNKRKKWWISERLTSSNK